MKRIVFPFLGMFMLWMTGCIKPGENILCTNYPMPAIVEFSNELLQPIFTTQGNKFFAQELLVNPELMEGNALLISFCVNYDQQPSQNYTTVHDLLWMPVVWGYMQATDEGKSVTGDFNLPIAELAIVGVIRDNWFFIFTHKNPSKEGFIYEMTYDINVPIIYCRAKNADQSSDKETKYGYYTFNMYSFFMTHKGADNKVRFKIQYKIGEDEEGNDLYNDFVDSFGYSIIEISVE